MTHLRKLMLEELQRRNYSQNTVETYTFILEEFTKYFHRAPDNLSYTQMAPSDRAVLLRRSREVAYPCFSEVAQGCGLGGQTTGSSRANPRTVMLHACFL